MNDLTQRARPRGGRGRDARGHEIVMGLFLLMATGNDSTKATYRSTRTSTASTSPATPSTRRSGRAGDTASVVDLLIGELEVGGDRDLTGQGATSREEASPGAIGRVLARLQRLERRSDRRLLASTSTRAPPWWTCAVPAMPTRSRSSLSPQDPTPPATPPACSYAAPHPRTMAKRGRSKQARALARAAQRRAAREHRPQQLIRQVPPLVTPAAFHPRRTCCQRASSCTA